MKTLAGTMRVLRRLLKSLTREQLETIASLLNVDQLTDLRELYGECEAMNRALRSAGKKAPSPAPATRAPSHEDLESTMARVERAVQSLAESQLLNAEQLRNAVAVTAFAIGYERGFSGVGNGAAT